MGQIYGYGCVSSVTIPRTDAEALKQTKVYQALKTQFNNMMLSEDCLHVDLITASYRTRSKLKNILTSSGFGDCIVITNISTLGITPGEIKENYLKIYEAGIGLLIPDYSSPVNDNLDPLSTCDWSMCLPENLLYNSGNDYPDIIKEKLAAIDALEVKTNRGREFKGRPENFTTVYWLYENYFLAEKDTYHNKLIDMGKKRFYRLATEYETTDPNYYKDLLEQEEKYHISEKPKRHGSVPGDFDKFLELLDNGLSLDEAAKQMNYNMINDIDFKRYQVKYLGGRKSMALANELRKTELALSLTKDVIADTE